MFLCCDMLDMIVVDSAGSTLSGATLVFRKLHVLVLIYNHSIQRRAKSIAIRYKHSCDTAMGRSEFCNKCTTNEYQALVGQRVYMIS